MGWNLLQEVANTIDIVFKYIIFEGIKKSPILSCYPGIKDAFCMGIIFNLSYTRESIPIHYESVMIWELASVTGHSGSIKWSQTSESNNVS